MALITALSFEEATPLLAEHGIELAELTPLSAGSVNSNFLLKGADGTGYFARIYEEQGPKGANFELLLGEALSSANIPVARPIRRTDGGLHSSIKGKPFGVYEQVNGEVLCQARVTPAAAHAVGAALAKVHLAPLGELEVEPGRFGFAGIEQRFRIVEKSGREDLLEAVGRGRVLAERLQRERSETLPCGLTHGDLFRDNVLVRGEADAVEVAALLDFESACLGPYVYDLMVTVLAWCYGSELDLSLTRAMVSGYHGSRPLSEDEREAMVLEGSIACLRFASTRLTDFSLRTPAGEAPARDFRRFFERLEALESGALDQALKGVF